MAHFLNSHLDFFPQNLRAVLVSDGMDSDFTRKCPPWKNGTNASGVPVCWLIIAEHLEETFNRQNIAESHPLLLFRFCTYSL
jgi:hypothetical protein